MVRGEPVLAFFVVLSIYLTLAMVADPRKRRLGYAVGLGVSIGLAILSRQWSFALFPAIGAFALVVALKEKRRAWPFLRLIIVSFVIAGVVGGWFYIRLKIKYGSVATFNREPQSQFAFSNQPPEFYFGLGLPELFTNPIRPSYPNETIPLFYSDTWGDYWCYFLVNGYTMGLGHDWDVSNRDTMAPYLGRVNLVSLPLSVLLVAGLVLGAIYLIGSLRYAWKAAGDVEAEAQYDTDLRFSLLQWFLVGSIIGYFIFLVLYPSLGKGATVKGTYMIQLFPFAAMLGAELFVQVKRKSARAYQFLLLVVIITFAHNLPAMFSRYIWI